MPKTLQRQITYFIYIEHITFLSIRKYKKLLLVLLWLCFSMYIYPQNPVIDRHTSIFLYTINPFLPGIPFHILHYISHSVIAWATNFFHSSDTTVPHQSCFYSSTAVFSTSIMFPIILLPTIFLSDLLTAKLCW